MIACYKRVLTHLLKFACALLLCLQTLAVHAEILQLPNALSVQRLVQQGQRALTQNGPEAAYALLSPYELHYAGNVDFDYLFGLTLLDTGRVDEAVFALQRVVSIDENFAGARMDLARAYFETGDDVAAKREFEQLLTQSPPNETRQVIEAYLRALDVREARYKRQLVGFVNIGVGSSSNANAATSEDVFLNFTLDQNSRAQQSTFGLIGLGGQLIEPINARMRLVAQANLSHLSNFDLHFVDQTRASLDATLFWRPSTVSFSVGVNALGGLLDQKMNYRSASMRFGAAYNINKQFGLRASLRVGALRFVESLNSRDVDQLFYELGGNYLFAGSRKPTLTFNLIGGRELAKPGARENGRKIVGMQSSAGLFLNPQLRFTVDVSALYSDYDGLFFGLSRYDKHYVASANFVLPSLPLGKLWSLQTRFRYVRNRSSVELYDYNAFDANVILRRNFK